MDEYLLVDGYNIIFNWEDLNKIASNNSLEEARDKLIDILSNYQGMKNINVIIVFDAHMVKDGKENIIDYSNVTVVYTKEAETADNYIERTTHVLNKKYKVKVATNDYLEQVIIMSKGAIRVSATELLHDVRLVNRKIKEKIYEIKPIKNNMLLDNLDPETAALIEKLRKE